MRRDFVANTSHELKTPVGAVSLLAEAIESAADEPDAGAHFAHRLTRSRRGSPASPRGSWTSSRLQAADELTDAGASSRRRDRRVGDRRQRIQADSPGVALVAAATPAPRCAATRRCSARPSAT